MSTDEPWKDTMELDDALSTPARIAILLFLLPRSKVKFSIAQKALGITAGNLSAHLKKLAESEYIHIEKVFVESKPTTLLMITPKGHSNIVPKHIRRPYGLVSPYCLRMIQRFLLALIDQ